MTTESAAPGSLSAGIRRRKKVDLVVGLDFGTSSSKVAYRELGASARVVTPILFDHGLETYPSYCLPSVGHLNRKGRFIWGPEAVRLLQKDSWSSGVRRLKVLVAGEVDPAFRDERAAEAYADYLARVGLNADLMHPSHVAALALAKQMHVVRGKLQEVYRESELDLRFNVCVPIDQYEHSLMLGVYHRIHHVAEKLYLSWTADGWDDADLLEVAASHYEGASTTWREDGRVFPVPEAMAEIASYRTSLETRKGIHAVIDIGAGTTDLSVFSLHMERGQDSECLWYAARNIPMGAGYVEARLADALEGKRHGGTTLTEAELLEALSHAKEGSEAGTVVRAGLMEIQHALLPTWVAAYNKCKKQTAWEGIPIFLCGGGSRMLGAREVFKKAWVKNFSDVAPRSLADPDDYNKRGGHAPFDRLSVAYGLTFLGPELGSFTLPSRTPDCTPIPSFKDLPEPWSDGAPG